MRADRLARDDRVFRWVCRRAIAEGQLRFNTTYAEAAAGSGYPVPRLNCRANRRRAREQRVSTVYRALCSLQAAGLVRFRGVKRDNGQWRCLSICLTPAAYGSCAPFGRSRRVPTRRPGRRIRFLRRNGTSPEVATAKNRSEKRRTTRARGRPPDKQGTEEGNAFLAAAQAPSRDFSDPPGASPWPEDFFDLRSDERVVILVDLFESEFGIPAKFSYRDYAEQLQLILDRFDRFTGRAGDRGGWWTGRWRPGAGLREASALIRHWGKMRRLGNRRAVKVRSLAYFLPKLDQLSKKRRRTWRAREGLEVWGPIEER